MNTTLYVPGYTQGRLTLLHRTTSRANSDAFRWWVRCECGRQWSISLSGLSNGAVECRQCSFATGGAKKRRAWSDEEVALLGTISDCELARRLGCFASTVRSERERRGVAPWRKATGRHSPRRRKGNA